MSGQPPSWHNWEASKRNNPELHFTHCFQDNRKQKHLTIAAGGKSGKVLECFSPCPEPQPLMCHVIDKVFPVLKLAIKYSHRSKDVTTKCKYTLERICLVHTFPAFLNTRQLQNIQQRHLYRHDLLLKKHRFIYRILCSFKKECACSVFPAYWYEAHSETVITELT